MAAGGFVLTSHYELQCEPSVIQAVKVGFCHCLGRRCGINFSFMIMMKCGYLFSLFLLVWNPNPVPVLLVVIV